MVADAERGELLRHPADADAQNRPRPWETRSMVEQRLGQHERVAIRDDQHARADRAPASCAHRSRPSPPAGRRCTGRRGTASRRCCCRGSASSRPTASRRGRAPRPSRSRADRPPRPSPGSRRRPGRRRSRRSCRQRRRTPWPDGGARRRAGGCEQPRASLESGKLVRSTSPTGSSGRRFRRKRPRRPRTGEPSDHDRPVAIEQVGVTFRDPVHRSGAQRRRTVRGAGELGHAGPEPTGQAGSP